MATRPNLPNLCQMTCPSDSAARAPNRLDSTVTTDHPTHLPDLRDPAGIPAHLHLSKSPQPRSLAARGFVLAFAPTSFAKPFTRNRETGSRDVFREVGLGGVGNPLPLSGGRAPIALLYSIPNLSGTSECPRAPGPPERAGPADFVLWGSQGYGRWRPHPACGPQRPGRGRSRGSQESRGDRRPRAAPESATGGVASGRHPSNGKRPRPRRTPVRDALNFRRRRAGASSTCAQPHLDES